MNDREKKASADEIRARFDQDVERFSNIETGQSATVDAALTLQLAAETAAALVPHGKALLDIGCGAGNFTLKLMDVLPELKQLTLIDLSQAMLDRACERILVKRNCAITALQVDVRDIVLNEREFDVVLAAAVLHHLRGDDEWRSVFAKIHRSLRPNGTLLVSDLVSHSIPAVHYLMWKRYGDYLAALKGAEYRDHVFEYIAYEDTPRPVVFQLDLLREAGFREVEILHKNSCFAAFVAIK